MRKLVLGLALILSLAACQIQAPRALTPTLPQPQVAVITRTPPPAATATLRPASATAGAVSTPAAPVSATLAAADGVALATTFYAPVQTGSAADAKAPGVLLLPMVGERRTAWEAFARALQLRGFAVLAMDYRGQGESSGTVDWTKAPADVRAVWQALLARPEVDAKRSAIVGASIGANLALVTGAGDPSVVTVIALSPGQDFRGVQPASGLGNFGQRGVLFVASQDDAYSYDSVRQMAPLVPKGETNYYAKAGHGTAMFAMPTLEPLLISWLEDHLGVLKG
jgi:pimeloyl-ACP methyl ester carboxylesterase